MSFFSALLSYFANFGKALIGQLGTSVAQFLEQFVVTDLGKLAVDAVAYVNSNLATEDKVAKRDAAVAKLKEDAKAAGHDLETFAVSTLNFIIESAYQAFQVKVATTTVPPISKL